MQFRDIAYGVVLLWLLQAVVAKKWCRSMPILEVFVYGKAVVLRDVVSVFCAFSLRMFISSDIQNPCCISFFLGCWLCSSNCTYPGPHAWSGVKNTKRGVET